VLVDVRCGVEGRAAGPRRVFSARVADQPPAPSLCSSPGWPDRRMPRGRVAASRGRRLRGCAANGANAGAHGAQGRSWRAVRRAIACSRIRTHAIFNFQALLIVILLTICTCAYLRANFPSIIDRNKTGYCGVWVLLFSKEWSMSCVCMGSACLCPHCRACLLCISVRPRERSMGIY